MMLNMGQIAQPPWPRKPRLIFSKAGTIKAWSSQKQPTQAKPLKVKLGEAYSSWLA